MGVLAAKADVSSIKIIGDFVEIEFNGNIVRRSVRDWYLLSAKETQTKISIDTVDETIDQPIELFKELAINAHFNIYTSDLWQGTAERFAKSVVQECIQVVSDAVDHREPASTYADKIKRHFGIE